MSEQSRPEQHRDYYPHDSSQVLEWHERRHEAVHEILTKAGIKGSLTLLVEERVQRLACLHLEAVAKVQRLTSELESAQKMADHWEKKAAERQGQVNEWRAKVDQLFDENERVRGTLDAANVVKYHPANAIGECKLMTLAERVESLVESWNNWEQVSFKNLARAEEAETVLSNRNVLLGQVHIALDAADVETTHPDIGAAERKPMMPHERIEWLGKDRDNWESRAKKAEAELSRFMNMPSCSPELFLRSAQRVEKPAPIDWQRVRIDAAMLILRLLPSNSVGDGIIEEVTKGAVKWADALVAELQKKEVQG